MFKRVIIVLMCYLYNVNADCLIIMQNNQNIIRKGQCNVRYSPCSTFKIAISLMGYNEGVLIDSSSPKLPFKEWYVDYIDTWKSEQTPTTWIKNSCVWYSQLIVEKIGKDKFTDYVKKFNYGNEDVSGNDDKNSGFLKSWLTSSLKISPLEQMGFLQQFYHNQLPVNAEAYNKTKNLLYIKELHGWQLYGKTGTCAGNKWFVGFLEKQNNNAMIVYFVDDIRNRTNITSYDTLIEKYFKQNV